MIKPSGLTQRINNRTTRHLFRNDRCVCCVIFCTQLARIPWIIFVTSRWKLRLEHNTVTSISFRWRLVRWNAWEKIDMNHVGIHGRSAEWKEKSIHQCQSNVGSPLLTSGLVGVFILYWWGVRPYPLLSKLMMVGVSCLVSRQRSSPKIFFCSFESKNFWNLSI